MTDPTTQASLPNFPFARSRPPEGDEQTWSVFSPQRSGAWPGFLENAAGERTYAVFAPETSTWKTVTEGEDPLVDVAPAGQSELISWRPFLRATYQIGSGPSADLEKRMPKEAAAAWAAHSRAVTSALARLPGGAPRAPSLLQADEVKGHFRFGAVDGRSLHEMLSSDHDLGLSALPKVARALTILHQSPVPEGFAPAAPSPLTTEEWLAILTTHVPKLAPAFAEAQAALPPLVEAPSRVFVHGDLHDKNIVLSEPMPTFLAWDLAHLGDPADEVANLGAHLVLRALQRGKKPADARGLANRWFGLVKDVGHPAARPQLRGPLARHFFRLAAIYTFRRRWRGVVSLLLAESRRWSERAS